MVPKVSSANFFLSHGSLFNGCHEMSMLVYTKTASLLPIFTGRQALLYNGLQVFPDIWYSTLLGDRTPLPRES